VSHRHERRYFPQNWRYTAVKASSRNIFVSLGDCAGCRRLSFRVALGRCVLLDLPLALRTSPRASRIWRRRSGAGVEDGTACRLGGLSLDLGLPGSRAQRLDAMRGLPPRPAFWYFQTRLVRSCCPVTGRGRYDCLRMSLFVAAANFACSCITAALRMSLIGRPISPLMLTLNRPGFAGGSNS
jgi:hypothetical protein